MSRLETNEKLFDLEVNNKLIMNEKFWAKIYESESVFQE